IKFKGQEHVSPLETSVPDIGDSEVQHLDFGDFWNRLTCPNPAPMEQMINDSGIAYAAGFPISLQCTNTMLTYGAHFNSDTKELTNVHGELIEKLDVATIIGPLRIPETEDSIILTLARTQTLFEKDNEKYK
ncbi:hypothetical protein KI387_021036, partial [Taxus chinensis]